MISRFIRPLLAIPVIMIVMLTLSSCSLLKNMEGPAKKEKIAELGEVADLRPLNDEEKSGDLGVKDVFPDYRRDAPGPKTKIFLVAAGADIANFLQEVVEQRAHFNELGYTDDEIACYYVKPTAADYASDEKQFAVLAPRATGFHLAAPHILYRHLRAAAQNGPDFVYLYVSGHGRQPLIPGVTISEQPSPDEIYLIQRHSEFSSQFRLDMMGGPSGHMNLRMRVAALDDGIDPALLFLTPRYLKEALSAFPETTPKVVVLQGCYSGGFVKNDIKSLENEALSTMPNVVALAASNWDRQSFGCKVDAEYTYWGGLYVHTLKEYAASIPETPWALVAASVEEKVDDLEIQLGLPDERASNPVYFSNVVPTVAEGQEATDEDGLVSQAQPLSLLEQPNPFPSDGP